jgi:hypothetical protein
MERTNSHPDGASAALSPQPVLVRRNTRRADDGTLVGKIRGDLSPVGYSNQRFLPENSIQRLLIRQNIEDELERCKVETSEKLVDFIEHEAKRVFATLVYSEKTAKIRALQNYQFTDVCLPVLLEDVGGDLKVTSLANKEDYSDAFFDEECHLSNIDIEHFCNDHQWIFTAPVFTKEPICKEYHEKTIAPFIFKGDVRRGGFSKVSRIHVHPDHQSVLPQV